MLSYRNPSNQNITRTMHRFEWVGNSHVNVVQCHSNGMYGGWICCVLCVLMCMFVIYCCYRQIHWLTPISAMPMYKLLWLNTGLCTQGKSEWIWFSFTTCTSMYTWFLTIQFQSCYNKWCYSFMFWTFSCYMSESDMEPSRTIPPLLFIANWRRNAYHVDMFMKWNTNILTENWNP